MAQPRLHGGNGRFVELRHGQPDRADVAQKSDDERDGMVQRHQLLRESGWIRRSGRIHGLAHAQHPRSNNAAGLWQSELRWNVARWPSVPGNRGCYLEQQHVALGNRQGLEPQPDELIHQYSARDRFLLHMAGTRRELSLGAACIIEFILEF